MCFSPLKSPLSQASLCDDDDVDDDDDDDGGDDDGDDGDDDGDGDDDDDDEKGEGDEKDEEDRDNVDKIVKDESKSESESESDSDNSNKLDDLESDGGGYKQIGGYNANRYYLNRLNRYDKDLFSGYSMKEHKSQKQSTQKYTYAGKCGAVIGRQPVAITKSELDIINIGCEKNEAGDLKTPDKCEGEGISFNEAVTIEGRDQDIYYICPKYWDIKNDKPLDPKKVDEFKGEIINNNMTTQQKKQTDKYILVRDEGGYWDQAGDDITRYKIDLLPNVHPNYNVPCCRAPREGSDEYKKGWKVDVLVDIKGKLEWKVGTVESSTKLKVKINRAGSIQTYNKKNVRRHNDSKYITNTFPCNLGSYGHIHPIIKQLVDQDIQHPNENEHKIGLIRKGIKRGNDIGDHSFLDSLQEILSHTNSSIKELRKNIINDLYNISNIQSIGGGCFINTFKVDINTTDIELIKEFINLLTKKYSSLVSKYIKKKLSIIDTFIKLTTTIPINHRIIVNNEFKIYSSMIQFKKYLEDENEIILDTVIIPVLISISKFKSKTFGNPINDLSIIVFEGTNEDVIISPYNGGFVKKSSSMILLYKERNHKYEPILYRRYDAYRGIITSYADNFEDQNNIMEQIIHCIQDKVDEYNNDNYLFKGQIMDVVELTNIMQKLQLPIHKYVYDDYNKIIHIITDKRVLIPVRPSSINNYKPLTYINEINDTNFPIYSDVIDILKLVDTHSNYKKYLDNSGISIIGYKMEINEIILDTGHYIPVKKEIYNKSKHRLDIITIYSYKQVDKCINVNDKYIDIGKEYILEEDYKKRLTDLFFQKVYLMLKDDTVLLNKIRTIINHPIKLRVHKSEDIYKLLNPITEKLVQYDDSDFDLLLDDEYKNKLIIRSIYELTNKDIYIKLLKSFIELLIIYDISDYDRFLQLDVSLVKIKQLLKNNEILFTYSDILHEYYLEHFIRNSKYIRNVDLYGEGITQKKLTQLNKQKDKSKKELSIVKHNPQIIRTLFGRGLTLFTFLNENISEIQLISDILSDIVDIMSVEIIKSLLNCEYKHKLNELHLDILANKYNIGFCLVSTLVTKLLEHDIIIKLPRNEINNDIQMILLYQNETNMIHIQKNGKDTIPLGDIKSKLFMKHLLSI